MTGSTIELGLLLNHNVSMSKRIMESVLQKDFDEGIMDTVKYLRGQAEKGDIGSMLTDERFMLAHSLKYSANSKEEKSSLQSAIMQLDESRRCFESLNAEPETYKKNVVDTYPTKKKEAGLPLDAARDFFKSHSTRLSNILSGKSSHFEKVLVRQRKDNLHVIRDAYVELQRKALGMESPKKDKGLSR